MTGTGGLFARPYRADRVAAAGAGLALAAVVLLPFASYSANRVVAGVAHPVWAAGPAGLALVASCAAALAAATWPAVRRGEALIACAAAMIIALAWSLGQAAVLLRVGEPGISRVSIGAGAWLVGAGTAAVWFAALHAGASRRMRVGAVVVTLAGLLAAALFGGMGQMSIVTEYREQTATFWSTVGTHLEVSGISLALAIALGVPLGVVSARVAWVRTVALGVVSLIQTVPSLALLGLLIFPLAALGLPGIGPLPAVIALTLYALLPIVRNTYVGLSGVDPAVVDAGRGMGMSGMELLARVEAPLALPLIIEGVRSAAVLVLGIAAVVALIGVGTLGLLVFEGLGQAADDLVLLGAVPMVVLAVTADWALRALARYAVSPGIRRETA